jgi:transposase
MSPSKVEGQIGHPLRRSEQVTSGIIHANKSRGSWRATDDERGPQDVSHAPLTRRLHFGRMVVELALKVKGK